MGRYNVKRNINTTLKGSESFEVLFISLVGVFFDNKIVVL